jgi:hypothetical protein
LIDQARYVAKDPHREAFDDVDTGDDEDLLAETHLSPPER